MIRLFGAPMSSSGRCHIMLEEVGVPYEFVHTNPREPSAEFRAINPGGKIPFLVDGTFTLFESMAINHYLGAKYKPELVGKTVEEQARIDQWSFWAISNVQPEALKIFFHREGLPPDQRQAAQVEAGKKNSERYLHQLEQALTSANSEWLVGNRFTVADLNVGSVMNWLSMMAPDLFGNSPKVAAHVARLRARPAFERVIKTSS